MTVNSEWKIGRRQPQSSIYPDEKKKKDRISKSLTMIQIRSANWS
jgi:hypothetical protein